MAKLKNKQYATFDKAAWGRKTMVMVGHNRTLNIREDAIGGTVLEFRLHGHMVVEYVKQANGTTRTLYMDDCGYAGPTTQAAIKDACSLFGFRGSVSFAKGGFEPRLNIGPGECIEPLNKVNGAALYQWEA